MSNQPPPELTDAAPTARKGHKGKGRSAAVKETTVKPLKRDQTPAYKPPPPGMEKAKQVGQVKPLATMSINAMKKVGMKPTNHIPKILQDDIADYADLTKMGKSNPETAAFYYERLVDPYNLGTEANLTSFLVFTPVEHQIQWIQGLGVDGSDEWVRDIVYNGGYGYAHQPPPELIKLFNDAKEAERTLI